MHIEEVIIDGFKSYATRTVVSGFDPKFNAITGLNGSGKSNILDSICFVLGITNLSQVRASNLQELVYKQGQAGVTKASVTIVFNNSDSAGSPVGYEQYDQITVTRQVVIGGRNKYLINGHNAQVSQVQNLFHSVQLNVNNPHFLIMQGRITKVLNMKPPEILGMIEEAAGTRMYENKKQAALRIMEKKQKKVDELNKILSEEITPTLEKLRGEKSNYLKWASNNTEMERLERFCIAHSYVMAESQLEKAEKEIKELENLIQTQEQSKEAMEQNRQEKIEYRKQIQAQKDEEMEETLKSLKSEEDSIGKEVVHCNSIWNNTKKTVEAEEKNIKEIKNQLKNLETNLIQKQKEFENAEATWKQAQEKTVKDAEAVNDLLCQLQGLSAGVETQKGNRESLNDQLNTCQKEVESAKAMIQQLKMKQGHYQKLIKQQEKQVDRASRDEGSSEHEHQGVLREIGGIENQLKQLSFNPREEDDLLKKLDIVKEEIRSLQYQVEELSRRVSTRLKFDYSAPYANFDHSKVKGVIAKLVSVKSPSTANALEVAAGGKLYHVVVDTEETGKSLLKHGRLKTRVTIVPLNRISRRVIPSEKIKRAENIAQKYSRNKNDGVWPALSLVGYPEQVIPAMEYAFGTTFICSNMEIAKKVTFDPNIKVRSVTIEGDSFDPAGTLQGGSSTAVTSLLLSLNDLRELSEKLGRKKEEAHYLEQDLERMKEASRMYRDLTQKLEFKRHECSLIEERIASSEFVQMQNELNTLKQEFEDCSTKMIEETQREEQNRIQCKDLELRIHDLHSSRDTQMKRLEKSIEQAKKKSNDSIKNEKKQCKTKDLLALEVEEIRKDFNHFMEQEKQIMKALETLNKELEHHAQDLKLKKDAFHEIQERVSAKRADLTAFEQEEKKAIKQEEKISQEIKDMELELKKNMHKLTRCTKDGTSASRNVEHLIEKHPWIENEKEFFGREQTDYCFTTHNPTEAHQRLSKLREEQGSLSKKINKKVMGMIEKAEQEYTGLMNKRHIIENDKEKIQHVIKELDSKKKEALEATWQKVNKDFGSIFSTVLPGTNAKLDTVAQNGSVLEGLQVKVAFGNVWKETLTELSGGQRSLLALSLILSLLLFKPAPMYILDEVDAALDLSHTQNIGQMIKKHFAHSQFIVVSLKEGMFNNANVVFRTKFVDGISTVTRTTNKEQRRKK